MCDSASVLPLPLNSNYTKTQATERRSTYRDALFTYAAKVVARACLKTSEQWTLFSLIEPSTTLFVFSNHQRLVFHRRSDRLLYNFRTTGYARRVSPYSFRVLWLVQSPVFHEIISNLLPSVDKGSVFLTFSEQLDTFFVRLSWCDEPYVPDGEELVQVLVDYNQGKSDVCALKEEVSEEAKEQVDPEPEVEQDASQTCSL